MSDAPKRRAIDLCDEMIAFADREEMKPDHPIRAAGDQLKDSQAQFHAGQISYEEHFAAWLHASRIWALVCRAERAEGFEQQCAALTASNTELRAALAELCELKALSERIKALSRESLVRAAMDIGDSINGDDELAIIEADYKRRKPLAWAKARALTEQQT